VLAVTGLSHAATAVALASLTGYGPNIETMLSPELAMRTAALACAAFGSLLPDIDEDHSLLGRRLPSGRFSRALLGITILYLGLKYNAPAAIITGGFFLLLAFATHRGVTHSVVAWAAVKVAAQSLIPTFWRPLLLGYSCHIIFDALTPAGVPLLWPIKMRFRLPLIRVGGKIDKWLGQAGGFIALSIALGIIPPLFYASPAITPITLLTKVPFTHKIVLKYNSLKHFISVL
jgi:inner membrane protein